MVRAAVRAKGIRLTASKLKGSVMNSKLGVFAAGLVAAAMVVPASAHEAGDWIFRAGVGTVAPKSGNLDFGDVVVDDENTVVNSTLEVDDGTSLTLTATYMIYDNWAVDILAAWPFEHDIDLEGTLNGAGFGAKAGETKHLPPTVSLQYHFAPDGTFQPYVGIGVNYTTFFSEDVSDTSRSVGLVDIELEDSWGAAFQLGADWMIGEKWFLNADVRYIQIQSDLKISIDDGDGNVTTGIDTPGQVEIDPWVWSLNVGFKL